MSKTSGARAIVVGLFFLALMLAGDFKAAPWPEITGPWPKVDVPWPEVAGIVATDFTADANLLGCWIMYTSAQGEAGSNTDRCAANGDDSMITVGAHTESIKAAPAGSNGRVGVLFDGLADGRLLADDDAFEAADFTVGCWVNQTAAVADTFMTKDDLQDWELQITGGGAFKPYVNTVGEQQVISTTVGTWGHHVLRYAGSTTQEVEAFSQGFEQCNGACEPQPTPPTGNAQEILLGKAHGTAKYAGDLMECFYADRAMTDTEICEVMLCGLDGSADGVARSAAFGSASCSCDTIETCC